MLHVVLLHWNQAQDVIRLLERLQGAESHRLKLWVVDNASREEEKQQLRTWQHTITWIENEHNHGYAGGINRALAMILGIAGGDDIIALVNNDVETTPTDLMALAESLQCQQSAGVIGPLLIERDKNGEHISWGGRDISRFIQTRMATPGKANPHRGVYEVDYVPGTMLLLRCAMLKQIGLLDETYFFSGEVADLCWRARAAGWHCLMEPNIKIRHWTGDASKIRSTLYRYYTLRNRFYFIRKHKAARALWLYAYWTIIGLVMAARLWSLRQWPEANLTIRAIRDGWAGRFGAIHA